MSKPRDVSLAAPRHHPGCRYTWLNYTPSPAALNPSSDYLSRHGSVPDCEAMMKLRN